MFQNFGLLPHLSVLENIAFPLRMQGVGKEEREQRACELVELVELTGREKSYPRELSGGQQQRVGFARSLAVEPEIWLLDEPFSALDPLIRRQMQDEFLRLNEILNKTVVIVTHDFPEALRLADRIAIMKDGQIIQTGTQAQVLKHPADDYVAEFTRDAPMIHVLTAGEIVEPLSDASDGSTMTAVRHDTPLAEIPRSLVGREGGIAVLDAAGAVTGQITPYGFIKALDDLESGDAR